MWDFGQVDASGCEGLFEAGDAFFRRVFSGDAAQEMEGGVGGGDLVQQDVGQHARTALVVGDDGGRVGAGQVDVDARDIGGVAQVVERFRVGDADDEQEFDLMGQQALDHFAFGFRIALGADDHRAEASGAGSGFEGFGQAGEEAVAVMRHDHAGQTGAGEAEAARLHVDVVVERAGGIEDARGRGFADPVALPRAVQHHADGRGRGARRCRDVVDGGLTLSLGRRHLIRGSSLSGLDDRAS